MSKYYLHANNIRSSISMNRKITVDMDVISEEHEQMTSDPHLQDNASCSSCDLLIRAHDRIRELEDENR